MKSRLAILGMLVLGLLLSTAGTGLAITDMANNDRASTAQYRGNEPTTTDNSPPPTNPTTTVETLTPNAETPPVQQRVQASQPAPEQIEVRQQVDSQSPAAPVPAKVKGEQDEPTLDADVQPSRQLAAAPVGETPGQLPFTGLAAVPILIAGVALMTGGLVLRRRAAGAG